jgi:alpha-L-rhamnosidase
VVPPNTTAVVDLPHPWVVERGSEATETKRRDHSPDATFEVGSGVHEWRFAAPSQPERGPLPGLAASLSDVIDDPRAYRAVLDTLASIDPERAEAVRVDTLWGAGRPLSAALMFTPPDMLTKVDEAVRAATS